MAERSNALTTGISARPRLGTARAGHAPLTGTFGPLLYGGTFVVLLPIALAEWARAARGFENMPRVHAPLAGTLLALLGLALWGAGAHALMRYGRGLPMNAYPPPQYVDRGIYRYLAHPIYLGFLFIAAGAAAWSGSAAAQWLVLPVLALSMTALVVGYETPALHARFGSRVHSARISFPRAGSDAPDGWSRASLYLLVLLPWALCWSAVQLLGMPRDAQILELAVDRAIPVRPWTWWIYATPYLIVPALPLLARTRSDLRHLAVSGTLATIVIGLLWFVLPVAYPPRLFSGDSLAAELLALDRQWCTGMAAFPAFHAVWSLIAADTLTRRWPKAAPAFWLWAVAVIISCSTTGMHGLLDLAAGVLLFPLFRGHARVWVALRSGTERIANSWREWHFGRVRVINHGAWAGVAGAAAAASLLLLAPAQSWSAALGVALAGLLGAGAWAQLVESSSGLLRPFGYYGAVFGSVAFAAAGPLLGFDGMLLLAALAVGAPWVQLLGRFRCLVQGCCHGRPASPGVGIHYRHPRSRVSYLAGLANEPLHATPLYSMLSNLVLGGILMRLWLAGAPQALVIGVYLIGNGIGRFVEEGYRGEPQTPEVLGLRLYQWLALAFVLAGAVFTTIRSAAAPPLQPVDGWIAVLPIVAFGVLAAFAMGVDFPRSNARFSRLAT